MITYLIDENMPFLPFWDTARFVQVTAIPFIHYDTDIWEYTITHDLIIITKMQIFITDTFLLKKIQSSLGKNRQFEKKYFNSVN